MIVETPLALYGLAHAPRKWNDSVVAFLLENGWEQLKSDRCVFALRDKDGALCALAGLHFDDFLLPGLPAFVQTLIDTNKLIREPWQSICAMLWSDASQGNRLHIAPESLGSKGSEVQAITMGENQVFLLRAMWYELHGRAISRYDLAENLCKYTKGGVVLDSKGILYAMPGNVSALHGLRSPRAAFELTVSVQQAVALGTRLGWMNGTAQLADGLTKDSVTARRGFFEFLAGGQRWSVVRDPSLTAGKELSKPQLHSNILSDESAFIQYIQQFATESHCSWNEEVELYVDTEPSCARDFDLQPQGGLFSIDQSDDSFSQKTDQIDNFLSHDWGTSRFLKVITLLWMFNVKAATIATFVMSCIIGCLRIICKLEILDHWHSTFFGYATFVIVLCWWQRIQSLFGFRRMVFLDKLCIAQHDAELKQQGILGLAGFLEKSNKLTVLWTPRWATRLWCTYELAAFMQQGADRPIELMPVKLASILLMQCACWSAISIAHAIVAYGFDSDQGQQGEFDLAYRLTLVELGVVVVALLVLMVHTGLWFMKELAELPGQLKAFRIQDAACYCCAHGHRHPKTGAKIPCDREYVYWMIRRWFHDPEAPAESNLDSFNAMVREQLAPVVLKHAGGSTLPLSYALYACAACNLPWLIDYIPWWWAAGDSGEKTGIAFFLWFLRGLMLYLYHALLQLAMMRICTMMWKALLPLADRIWRVVLTTVQIVIMLVIAMFFWLAFRIVYQVTDSTSLLPSVPFFAVVILDITLFWRSGEQVPASDKPDHTEAGPSSSNASEPEPDDVEKKAEDAGGVPGHTLALHVARSEAEGPLIEVKL
ncbi:unnamed protein product [Symbiodinium microadriaticum]|nr:unnamed protein product [Symbiodinium microadriaticum]